MSNSSNEIALALLATLEARAKKKGKTSVVKGVAHHLREAGASAAVVAEVEALAEGKSAAAAPRKNGHKPAPKAKSKPAAVTVPAA